jgi:molybdate transport system permease protein
MEIDWFPFWLSLRVAALATLISLIAGLGLAYLLNHYSFRGRDLLDAVVTLPLVLPPTVLGYYLLVSLGRMSPVGKLYEALFGGPLVFTWQAAVVASTVHAIPLLVKSARAALQSVERDYERAARSLGASEWRVFLRVSLPLVRRQIVAATVLAFARSLGDFGTTLMIAGDIPHQTQTVSIAIYDAASGGHTLTARVLVLAVSALTIVIVYSANRLERRRATA